MTMHLDPLVRVGFLRTTVRLLVTSCILLLTKSTFFIVTIFKLTKLRPQTTDMKCRVRSKVPRTLTVSSLNKLKYGSPTEIRTQVLHLKRVML